MQYSQLTVFVAILTVFCAIPIGSFVSEMESDAFAAGSLTLLDTLATHSRLSTFNDAVRQFPDLVWLLAGFIQVE